MESREPDLTLRDKLLFSARAASARFLPSMKTAVRQATRISRPPDWREADSYGDGLMSLAAIQRQRLNGLHAEQVVELAELAIDGTEKSLEQIDDSSRGVMPAVLEAAAVHFEVCRLTGSDPVRPAERLFRLQTDGAWDIFCDVLPAYADPLGVAGLRRYCELVIKGWEALPALAPSNEFRQSFDSQRMRLEHAMKALAELDDDIDVLIRIRSKDLSSPCRFLQVAELCAKHGRPHEGLAESGKAVDKRLLDFCIEAYLRRSEFDKAAAFAWRRFSSLCSPTAAAIRHGCHDE